MRLHLVLLWLLSVSIPSHGFCFLSATPHRSDRDRHPTRTARSSPRVPAPLATASTHRFRIDTALQDRSDDDRDETTPPRSENKGNNEGLLEEKTSTSPDVKGKGAGWALATLVELSISYIIQFFGAAVTAGLVLNLCGYAYTFDVERGLEIGTIKQIREEKQFRAETLRLERFDASSSLPRKPDV